MRFHYNCFPAIAALCFGLNALMAHAAGPTPLSSPSALYTVSATSKAQDSLNANADREVKRRQRIDIDSKAFAISSGEMAKDASNTLSFALPLFDGKTIIADRERIEKIPRGTAWIGKVRGIDLSQVILVNNGNIVSGNITMPGGRYHIRFGKNGAHEIQEIDQSALPARDELLIPSKVSPAAKSLDASPALARDSGSIIDVMVLYTPAARAAAGSTAAMQSLVDLGVTETNQSFQNSGISPRIRLVYTGEVNYAETGSFHDDLVALTDATDGKIDDVHVLRDTYGADLVSMWVERGDACGIAWLMQTVSTDFAPYGFNVVMRPCATGSYTFAHEIGHNMSATHDAYVDSSSALAFPYAHGWVNTAARWRTIMAYNDACSAAGTSCAKLQYWSTPSLTYLGEPMGDSAMADNRRVLNDTASTVADFRQTTVASSCVSSISPSSAVASSAGASGTITVTAPAGCPWTATRDAPWITMTSGTSGTGSGTVSYTVAANTATDLRSGTITVAGKLYTVTQSGAVPTLRQALLLHASTSSNKTSVVRLTNTTDSAGTITATAYDESGSVLGAANTSLGSIGAYKTLIYGSADLERTIGFSPVSPTAKYSVYFSSTSLSNFEVINLTRENATGFLTLSQAQAHDRSTSTSTSSTRTAWFVSASTSTNKTNVLRLLNTGDQSGALSGSIYGENGAAYASNISLGTIAAREMKSYTSADLERLFGFTPPSPTSKYRVEFTATVPNLELINFTRELATGNLTLVQAQLEDRAISPASVSSRNALVVYPSTSTLKNTVMRIINPNASSIMISAVAYNESGTTVASGSLGTINGNQILALTSSQLESALGYTPTSTSAKYRLILTANASTFEVVNNIKVPSTGNLYLAHAQTDNRAAGSATTTTRNALLVYPATSTTNTTELLVVNTTSSSATLTATAYDDSGIALASGVTLGTLGGNQTLTFTSAQLQTLLDFTPSTSYRLVLSANLSNFEAINHAKDVTSGIISLAQPQTD